MSETVIEATDLTKHFPLQGGRVVRAVDGVNLHIKRGETLGLVGESGSGKTTVGRTLIRLYKPTSGTITFEGEDITRSSRRQLNKHAMRRMAMVFQNPSTSLNPHRRIGDALGEPLAIRRMGRGAEQRQAVRSMLERVGLDPRMTDRYPGELSGGQRQRVGIGRALMLKPSLVIADEPTASLDLSVQAQIVNLLQDIQEDLGLAYLFVTHDLSLVRHISHRIAVMYLGRVMETGPVAETFAVPLHPYTAVLASMQAEPGSRILPRGDIPSPIDPPSGCVFHTRCPIARPLCSQEAPQLVELEPGRQAACHFPGELQPASAVLTRRPAPIPMTALSRWSPALEVPAPPSPPVPVSGRGGP